ncbi:PTS sugar transporter subunit IIA [Thiorhodococcus fuscus]|uniref:PTS sugar transporter subunit IIA n=1 Tax=Thiorhodococcus fuscus TaxID=527200 RepID=A0ABW4Y9A0_9GAMM
MSVGVLLITHSPLARDLLRIAGEILGTVPAGVEGVEVVNDTPREDLIEECLHSLDRLDEGDGVLILSDLFGSTPCNVANRLLELRTNVQVLTGVNLPMLLRTLNYATLDLDAVAEKALQGGRDGVQRCKHD